MSEQLWTWNAFARGLLSSLFPPACAACPRVGREPFCRLCGEALEPASPVTIEGAERTRALWAYGGPVSIAVQRLKYQNRADLGRSLGEAMRPLLEGIEGEVVVPVPLTRRRLRERGYNQARELARGLGLPVFPRALERVGDARDQVGLDKRARLENLKDAFRLGAAPLKGRSVILLDDVITTGATATAALRALQKAGPKRVVVLALAHTG